MGNHLTHTFIFVHICELHSRIFSLSQAREGRGKYQEDAKAPLCLGTVHMRTSKAAFSIFFYPSKVLFKASNYKPNPCKVRILMTLHGAKEKVISPHLAGNRYRGMKGLLHGTEGLGQSSPALFTVLSNSDPSQSSQPISSSRSYFLCRQ